MKTLVRWAQTHWGFPGHQASLPRSRDGRRGQALVEFALVLPVMLVLLLLAVDFGRLFFTYVAVNNAAREATYYAGAHAADDTFDMVAFRAQAQEAADRETNVQGQADAGALTVTLPDCFNPITGVSLDCDAAAQFAGGIGNHVTVSVSQPFSFLTPIVGDLFGGQVTLTAAATGPVLNPADVTILAGEPVPTPTPVPTATPTPTPTPTPEPTPTPTPAPGAWPTPTPTPTPAPTPTPTPTPSPMCTVPDFYHTYWNDIGALTVWHDEAGFNGTLTDESGGKKIQRQTMNAGTVVLCSSNMTVGK